MRLFLLLGLYLGTVLSTFSDTCFELPVIILSPEENFPKYECTKNQPPPPREHCMKKRIATTVQVLQNEWGLNCMKEFAGNNSNVAVYKDAIVHYRGASSLVFRKHQMALKFKLPKKFLGFPEDRSWVLNGPWIDGSMLRNHLGHWLYRNTGRYSPRTKLVILYLRNAESNLLEYKGIYVVIEHIGFGKNRVGLAINNQYCNATEINGGWAWQYNPLKYHKYSINMVFDAAYTAFGQGDRPILEYPKGNTLTQTMRNYFVNTTIGFLPKYIQYLYNRLDKPDELEQHIEIGSFVDYILHTELSLNQDAYRRSAWFFKDRNETINAGPAWDLNLAYGIGTDAKSQTWLILHYVNWKRLRCNYKVASLLIQRWKELRQGPWKDDAISTFIDESAAPVIKMLQRCPSKLWQSDKVYCASTNEVKNSGTYKDAINLLHMSIRNRAKWIDENINNMYMKLNESICGPLSILPQYNCAADGNDSKCLENVDAYANSIKFPPKHKARNGGLCINDPRNVHRFHKSIIFEKPSIDPCWLSSYSENVTNITKFCSGHGFCDSGPNAKCKYTNNTTTFDCTTSISSFKISKTLSNIVSNAAQYVVFLFIGCGFLFAVFINHKKRRREYLERSPLIQRKYIFSNANKNYGTKT